MNGGILAFFGAIDISIFLDSLLDARKCPRVTRCKHILLGNTIPSVHTRKSRASEKADKGYEMWSL